MNGGMGSTGESPRPRALAAACCLRRLSFFSSAFVWPMVAMITQKWLVVVLSLLRPDGRGWIKKRSPL